MDPANISPPPVGTMTGFVNRGRHRNTATQWWQEGILGPSPPFFMQHGSPAAPTRPVPSPLWGHTPRHRVAISPVALAMASGICLPFPWAHGLLRGKLLRHLWLGSQWRTRGSQRSLNLDLGLGCWNPLSP